MCAQDAASPLCSRSSSSSWRQRLTTTQNNSAVRSALFGAGAGAIGNYRECSWTVEGIGQFRPEVGAEPAIGAVGSLEQVSEDRIEVVAPASARQTVLGALTAVHPYEEPAFDIFEEARLPTSTGLGRIGTLASPTTLREFSERVRRALPDTAWGVRTAGDPDTVVRTVALCGGAGDSFLDAVRALGVDVYLTSDLRHHPVDERSLRRELGTSRLVCRCARGAGAVLCPLLVAPPAQHPPNSAWSRR